MEKILQFKNFLEKNINGAIHHICLEVKDINKTAEELKKKMLEYWVMVFLKMVPTINQFYFFIPRFFWNTNRIRAGVILLTFVVIFVILWWLNFIFNSSNRC